MMRKITICAAWLLIFFGSGAYVRASIGYVTGPDPWGQTTNDQAMNSAFGAANWNKLSFATAVGAGLFTPGQYSFIFIDGGDGSDTNFVNFLSANLATLQNWVSAGGSLLMNAATWNYGAINVGFGGTSHQAYDSGRSTASAANALHPIFDAGTGLAWSGNYFAHNDITGAGFTSIINDGFGRSVLAEKDWGLGHVMLGGITTTNFHNPQPQAFNLRVNMLEYGAAQVGQETVPELASVAVWSGLALIGAVFSYRKGRSTGQSA